MAASLVVPVALAALVALAAVAFARRKTPAPPVHRWGEPIARDRNLGALADAYRRRIDRAAHAVSERVWKDLSLDAVFATVDHALTSAGQHALYRRLREPAITDEDVRARDRRVVAFVEDEALRETVQRALRPLATASVLPLVGYLHVDPRDASRAPRGAPYFRLATYALVGAIALATVWPPAIGLVLACAGVGIAIRVSLYRAMTRDTPALVALVPLLATAQELTQAPSASLRPELDALGRALERVGTYRSALSWLGIDPLRTNEILEMIIAYLNVFLLLDVHAYVRALELVREHGATLRAMLDVAGEIDAARAIASFRAGTKTCAATFAPRGSAIRIDAMRHPLVEGAVANDIVLDRSHGWLVLGSNMSGKSTCLRGIALAACMAQSLGCVTADAYEGPLLLARTLIQVEDDVLAGKSHFLAEAEAARDLLLDDDHGTDRLCILDELFRGTNTVDRVAAGSALLRALHRGGAFVVAATHDAELLALLEETFRPHYFQERVEPSGLVFDYRLREGAMAPRNALAVLELVGFPADVLADARRSVAGGGDVFSAVHSSAELG